MTIDSSIPLETIGANPQKMMSLYDLSMKMQANQQAQQAQNQLRSIFSNPENLDPQGMPNPGAMSQIMAVNPKMGMELQKNALNLQAAKSKIAEGKLEFIKDAMGTSLNAYEDAKRSGLSEEASLAKGQEIYSGYFRQAGSSGLFEPKSLEGHGQFKPDVARDFALGYKERRTMERQDEQTKRQDRAETEREKHDRSMEGHALRMEGISAGKESPEAQAFAQFKKENPGATASEQQKFLMTGKGRGDDALFSDDEKKLMAQQYLAGDKSVLANVGRGTQGAKNIVALRGEIARQAAESGMNGADIAAKMAEFAGIVGGERTLGIRTANIGMGIAELQKFAPLATKASDKIDRTRFPDLNSLYSAGLKKTGGEDVVRFIDANNAMINAYAQIVSRGNAAITDSARAMAQEVLSIGYSKGQYGASVDQLMKEAEAAGAAPGIVREEFRKAITGGKPAVSDSIQQGAPAKGGPSIGTTQTYKGKTHKFTGGDPNDPKNWPEQ